MKNHTNSFMIVTENTNYSSKTDSTYDKTFFLHLFNLFSTLNHKSFTSFIWNFHHIKPFFICHGNLHRSVSICLYNCHRLTIISRHSMVSVIPFYIRSRTSKPLQNPIFYCYFYYYVSPLVSRFPCYLCIAVE